MTTLLLSLIAHCMVVETYRLDRYDNRIADGPVVPPVVEAYRLDGYDNPHFSFG